MSNKDTILTNNQKISSSNTSLTSILSRIQSLPAPLDTSDATATAGDILNTKTAYVNGNKITGNIPNNGALNYSASTSQQTIPAGYTTGGTIEKSPMLQTEYDNSILLANSILYGGEPPKQYTELEYIQSTGTQYIDTEILASTIRYLEFTFMPTSLANSYQAYMSAYPDNFTIGAFTSLTKTFLRYRTQEVYRQNTISTTVPTTIKIQNDGIYFNTTKYEQDTSSAISTTSQNLFIAATSSKTVPAAMKFYKLKLYNMSGELIADYIPVIHNNIVCIYNKVTRKYIYNSGSGNFIAGPEIIEED